MKAIVTVIGKDTVGIIAFVCTLLAEHNVTVLDISQTIVDGFFTMTMLADVEKANMPFGELAALLEEEGNKRALAIRAQREDIFNAMHRV